MKNYLNPIIFSVAIIGASLLFSNAFKNRNRSKNSISVTGLGSQDFTSDLVVWKGSFSKRSQSLEDAYVELESDRNKIKKFLLNKGVNQSEIVFMGIQIQKDFNEVFDERGNRISSTFIGYTLSQTLQVESRQVEKIEEISRGMGELITLGVEFVSEQPQYFYTKLSELKIKMIAEATTDAKLRAQTMAKNAGSTIGDLKSAEMGIFQIVGQNSSEDYSWGGSYNTSSKNKTASITVKLQYETK